jgi:signal transduction histidine kinase
MTHLVNDLLDLARVKHGRLRLERVAVELNGCILAAIEAHRARADAKGLTLDYSPSEGSVYIDADPERLMQILGQSARQRDYLYRPRERDGYD